METPIYTDNTLELLAELFAEYQDSMDKANNEREEISFIHVEDSQMRAANINSTLKILARTPYKSCACSRICSGNCKCAKVCSCGITCPNTCKNSAGNIDNWLQCMHVCKCGRICEGRCKCECKLYCCKKITH